MTIPRDIRVSLKDGAYAPDYEILRKTYWLHCRHTSVTYISRMVEMLNAFTQGFAAYLAKDSDPGTFADFLRICYECLAEQKEGLARLRKADLKGFKLIRGAMGFRDPFYLRADDWNFDPLGYHGNDAPGEALWAWMEKIIPMSLIIEGALWGRKSYPLFDPSKFLIPIQIGGYPFAQDVYVKDGEDIPITGVWQPTGLKGGCPNFLLKGEKAPKANLPISRIDTPAWDQKWPNGRIKHHEARSTFDLGEFPTVWRLIWEDDRWRNGREPLGEYEYLMDPATELPTTPPVALRNP